MKEEYLTEVHTSVVDSTPEVLAKALPDVASRPEMDDLDLDTLLRMAVKLETMHQTITDAVTLLNKCACDETTQFTAGALSCPIVYMKMVEIETEEGEQKNDD